MQRPWVLQLCAPHNQRSGNNVVATTLLLYTRLTSLSNVGVLS